MPNTLPYPDQSALPLILHGKTLTKDSLVEDLEKVDPAENDEDPMVDFAAQSFVLFISIIPTRW